MKSISKSSRIFLPATLALGAQARAKAIITRFFAALACLVLVQGAASAAEITWTADPFDTHLDVSTTGTLVEAVNLGTASAHDQLQDVWEKAFFAGVDATDGSDHSDADTVSDRDEYVFGSSPVAGSSRPAQLQLDAAAGQLRITIPAADPALHGELVRRYEIRGSTDLVDWLQVLQSGISDGGEIVVPATFGEDAEFYRAAITVE